MYDQLPTVDSEPVNSDARRYIDVLLAAAR